MIRAMGRGKPAPTPNFVGVINSQRPSPSAIANIKHLLFWRRVSEPIFLHLRQETFCNWITRGRTYNRIYTALRAHCSRLSVCPFVHCGGLENGQAAEAAALFAPRQLLSMVDRMLVGSSKIKSKHGFLPLQTRHYHKRGSIFALFAVGLQFVVQRLEADLKLVGRARLVVVGLDERLEDQLAFGFIQ